MKEKIYGNQKLGKWFEYSGITKPLFMKMSKNI